jgi:predicted nucleotidyltransferase component of viral defense system
MESSIEKWVSESPPEQKEFRRAVQTILLAITMEPLLKDLMIIKGGILLAIKYQSGRFTKDIDFSSSRTLVDIKQEDFTEAFERALRKAVIALDLGLDCSLQKIEIKPPPNKNPKFPCYSIKVGYAEFGTTKHRRLQQKQSPSIVKIDFSLNELILNKTQLDVDAEHFLSSYDVNDLIAEKIRSLIQQVDRNRYRRQDVFDINILLRETNVDKSKVLESVKLKSESRDIIVNEKSLDNPEVRERAIAEYSTLADEVDEELPDFDTIYDQLLEFYKSLPWED